MNTSQEMSQETRDMGVEKETKRLLQFIGTFELLIFYHMISEHFNKTFTLLPSKEFHFTEMEVNL